MTPTIALLVFVTVERVFELWLARRNTARLIERGAHEVSRGHYPAIVLLHAAWLSAVWWYGWDRPLHIGWVCAFAVLQVVRLWTLATLGSRWTTRIIVVPGETPVRHGPYRYVDHPNYLVVIGEIAVLPLSLGLPLFALVFTVANAAMLAVRVSAENRAWGRVG